MQVAPEKEKVKPQEKPAARRAGSKPARENARAPVKTRAEPNEHKEPDTGNKVSTSGKTSGPHNPPHAEEDEDLSRTFLSEKPLARFDTHGTVAHVLADIDRHVPMIFGAEGEKALNSVHKLLRHYTENEKWMYVVASLSTGMARPELEGLLSRDLGHEGPIVIDPDAATEDHQKFSSETEARVQKERLIRANEESGKILLVLYAVNNPDGNKDRELMMGRLQGLSLAIGFFLEEDERFRQKWGLEPMDERLRREFGRLGLNFSDLIHKVTGLTSNNYLTEQHDKAFTDLSARLMGALNLTSSGELPIKMTIMRLGIIPSRWADLGIVDSEALEDAELARTAQEYRARLARGWIPPEERLRREAARTEAEHSKEAVETENARHKATARTIEARNKAALEADEDAREEAEENRGGELRGTRKAGIRASKSAAAQRRGEEREARLAREDDTEAARDRARLLNREARNDKLQDEHAAERNRLRQLAAGARTQGERDLYARQLAASDSNFAVTEEQEERLETRDRRNAQAQEQARVNSREEAPAQGTAEGAYATLAATEPAARENVLEQRQRGEYALAERREGEREAVNRSAEQRDQEIPVGAPRPQSEQAAPPDGKATKDTLASLSPQARAEELEKRQPDEASNPGLTTARRQTEEAKRPARQGELDTEETRRQHDEQEKQKLKDTERDLARQQHETERLEEEARKAREEVNERQREFNEQQRREAENRAREEENLTRQREQAERQTRETQEAENKRREEQDKAREEQEKRMQADREAADKETERQRTADANAQQERQRDEQPREQAQKFAENEAQRSNPAQEQAMSREEMRRAEEDAKKNMASVVTPEEKVASANVVEHPAQANNDEFNQQAETKSAQAQQQRTANNGPAAAPEEPSKPEPAAKPA